MDCGLNIIYEIVKLLEKAVGNLENLGIDNEFLDLTLKAQVIKEIN